MPDPLTGLRIRHVLREDALGEFVRADDPATGEPLCLRRIDVALANDESGRLLFIEEVRRIATLDHPMLLHVRRAVRDGPRPYLITDPIDAETLVDRVRRDGTFGAADARRFIADLLGALGQLESRRQYHAAIHPARFVRVGERWKLVTFRDVRAEDEASRAKGREAFDPRWTPPEGDARTSAPTKARPMTAWNVGALWRWLRTGKAPDEGPIPGVPPPDGALIERLLEAEPILRPAGASTLSTLVATLSD